MPKMKTHSGAKKRFKLTATGKVKHQRAKTRHMMSAKSWKVKRKLRGGGILNEMDAKRVRRLLPNN
jgi:large subunit ribosomal protein L35